MDACCACKCVVYVVILVSGREKVQAGGAGEEVVGKVGE